MNATSAITGDRKIQERSHAIFDHPWSGIVCNFGGICLSVCLSVCNTITFKSLDLGSSFFGPSVHPDGIWVKLICEVIGSRSRLHEQKR